MLFLPTPTIIMNTTSVYISGATGYIGGAVAAKLLSSKQYTLTALVRHPDRAVRLADQGIKTVLGSLTDSALIEDQVYNHDVTITAANCDSLDEARAVVKGLERKYKETGRRGLLIHTSGSGIVSDVGVNNGNQANRQVYSDLDTEALDALPPTHPHRHVDTFLIDHAAHYDLALIAPTTVFGEARHTVAFNPHSAQIPWAIAVALQQGAVYQVGQGLNSWSFVHVDDLAELYALVLATRPFPQGHYFLPESGYFEWRQATHAMGKHLHALGALASPEPRVIHDDDEFTQVYKFLPFKFGYGGNSRVSADKCRLIGWAPTKGLDDFLDDIARESAVFARKKGFIQ